MTTPTTTTTTSKSKPKPQQQPLFDPLATTPATNLTSPLPPDLDADILVIGGKDVRNILYTAYAEVGGDHEYGQQKSDARRRRKIDVTVSHEDKYVVARNVLGLSLVLGLDLDGLEVEEDREGDVVMEEEGETADKEKAAKEKLARIWDIYYTRFLPDPETRNLLASQAEKLCQVSKTMEDWEQGPYGGTIHFVTQKSLDAVRGVWEHYAEAARSAPGTEKVGELQSALAEGMQLSPDEQRHKWALGSSAAPLTVLLKDKIRTYVQVAWDFDRNMANTKMVFPNPTFAAGLLSESESPGRHRHLAYPSNGVLGYHLALTKAPLTELSPLRIDKDSDDSNNGSDEDPDGNLTALGVAKHQFTQWSLAFRELAAAKHKRLTIRFTVDGWFPLCQSFLHPPAKKQFDIIDTTDLSSSCHSVSLSSLFWSPFTAGVPDPPGLLGLLVAAKRLLKDRASSTLVMDDRGRGSLVVDAVDGHGNMDSNYSRSAQDEASISANNTTGAFILGLAPVEYWSNASVRATVDECLLAASSLYDEDSEQLQGLDKDKAAVAAAAAARVKKLEEQGLQIGSRMFRKHSRWLTPGQQHRGKWRKRPVVTVDAKELAEAAWRVYQYMVVDKIEGQLVVHGGKELVKIPWVESLWQTFLDLFGVVGGQFDTDREEFRRVIIEKIGGNSVQDAMLKKVLEEEAFELTTASKAEVDACPVFTASFDVTSGILKTITGHLDFVTEEDKQLLADKTVTISLRQSSPWTIDIVLGAGTLVKPLVFPTPVLKEGSKTRIARKSGYIEVIAPAILSPWATTPASVLDGYIFPTVLQAADSSSETSQLIPAPLNAPTVNLDSLPILSISDTSRLSFLGPLASSMYSPRELRERQAAFGKSLPESLWDSARLNLKESLHTIINIAAGLQVGQSGLFALCPVSGSGSSSSSSDGRHILILVSAIRLDCSAQSGGGVVIDAAVLPLTHSLLDKKKNSKNTADVDDEDLQSFLVLLRTLDCVDISVTDTELALWKSILPSFAERCRTWSHSPSSCEYATTGQIPLSLKKGDPVLCTCGTGHFPPNYLSLPLWETAAAPHATRVALSAPYCSPVVEKVVFDPALARKIAERGLAEALRKKEERCRSCGKGEEELVEERKAKGGETAGTTAEVLRKCARCLKVKYCSAECQRRDWKTHRTECVESEEHHR